MCTTEYLMKTVNTRVILSNTLHNISVFKVLYDNDNEYVTFFRDD